MMKESHFAALEAIGITRTDALILQALRKTIRRQERIAETIGVTQPTVSRRIEHLIDMGLVKFSREEGLSLMLGWSGTIELLTARAKELSLDINASIQSFRLSSLQGVTDHEPVATQTEESA